MIYLIFCFDVDIDDAARYSSVMRRAVRRRVPKSWLSFIILFLSFPLSRPVFFFASSFPLFFFFFFLMAFVAFITTPASPPSPLLKDLCAELIKRDAIREMQELRLSDAFWGARRRAPPCSEHMPMLKSLCAPAPDAPDIHAFSDATYCCHAKHLLTWAIVMMMAMIRYWRLLPRLYCRYFYADDIRAFVISYYRCCCRCCALPR